MDRRGGRLREGASHCNELLEIYARLRMVDFAEESHHFEHFGVANVTWGKGRFVNIANTTT